jgi:hypothetical protein
MRALLLNSVHCALQNQCISGDIRMVLLLGRHSQLRCGPTITVNDTLTTPATMLPSLAIDSLSHCLQEFEALDSIVGCAFVINHHDRLLQEVADKCKDFLVAVRRYLVAKGTVDVHKAMLDKTSKLIFVSMWGGVVRAEAKMPHSCCFKSSFLCHRVVYNEKLLGPEANDEKISGDVQYIGTSTSAVKRTRRSSRTSESEFSHIKSQDVDFRIWSGEGSMVHEFDVDFPAFVMPASDSGISGNLHSLFASLEQSNTGLHNDILTELDHCKHLACQYGVEYDRRSAMPCAAHNSNSWDLDSNPKLS